MVFMSPRKTDSEMAIHYSSSEYRENMSKAFTQAWMDDNEYKRSKRIADLITDGKSVLDVGCSRGYVLQIMQGRGYEALGVESNSDYVNEGVVFVNSIDDIEGSGFDNITCIHTLEHVPDFMHLCKRMVELLNPGGKLIIEVPGLQTSGGPFGSEHIYYFTPDVIKKIFSTLKFEKKIQTPHECLVFRNA